MKGVGVTVTGAQTRGFLLPDSTNDSCYRKLSWGFCEASDPLESIIVIKVSFSIFLNYGVDNQCPHRGG